MPWLALAASLALLAAGAGLFLRPSPVLTLIESTGTVVWNHGVPVLAGEKLPAGTLETVGETSSAQLRFADGTLLTLHGEAELTFSDEGQKILALSRGTLSAQVRPQPPGHPMRIRTPSAEAEVAGTAFDLTARAEDTLLKVNEGLVKLQRLSDGSRIDVSANRSAVASLSSEEKLDAAPTPEPLAEWSFDFSTQTPPRDWRGFAGEGRMNARAYVAKRHPDGRITTHYGISSRTAMLPEPLRLLATDSSVIRYRLRQGEPGDLQLMLITNRPDGGFGGNFECRIQGEELRPGPDGWVELTVPLGRFQHVDPRPHMRERHPTSAGNIITSAILSTFRENRQLAVERFDLQSRP